MPQYLVVLTCFNAFFGVINPFIDHCLVFIPHDVELFSGLILLPDTSLHHANLIPYTGDKTLEFNKID
jgi:hypothetical protein